MGNVSIQDILFIIVIIVAIILGIILLKHYIKTFKQFIALFFSLLLIVVLIFAIYFLNENNFDGTWTQANGSGEIIIAKDGNNQYNIDISSDLIEGLDIREGHLLYVEDRRTQKQFSLINGLTFHSGVSKNEIEYEGDTAIKITLQKGMIVFKNQIFLPIH